VAEPNIFQRVYAAMKQTPRQQQVELTQGEVAYADINGLIFGKSKEVFTVYNPSILVTNQGMKVIDKMRKDAQVKVALNFKKHAILSTGWCVESPEGMDEDWDVKEFVEEELGSLPGTLDRRLRNILSAIDYGYSITEPVWEKRPDGKVGYRTLKTRRPHNFTFDCDPHGNVAALRQMGNPLPPERFIVYSFIDEFENPYGASELEAAYVPWWLKDNAYKFLGILLERLGIPPIFAHYNAKIFPKSSDQTALRTILKTIQTGTSATIARGDSKDDISFWAPEIAGQASSVFIPALEHADNDIAKAILLPGLLGGTSDSSSGSFARSQTHFDMFMLVIQALRNELENTIVQKQIIEPLVDMNFSGITEYPQFRFNPLEIKDIVKLMETWGKLVADKTVSKQPEDEAYIREQMEMPPVSDLERSTAILDQATPPPPGAAGGVNPPQAGQPPPPGGSAPPAAPVTPNGQPPAAAVFSINTMQREPNQYETHIDFATVESSFNTLEIAALSRLKEAYTGMKDSVVKFVQNNYDMLGPKIAGRIGLRNLNQVQSAMRELLRSAFDAGDSQVRKEIPKAFAAKPVSGFAPQEALDYLKQKEVTSVATVNDRLLGQIKTTLLTALRGQKTSGEAMDAVTQLFAPLIGESPAYAETVVRTNLIDAYNQGRLTAIRDPDVSAYVAGVEYSAIIDSRTTELCAHLDQKVFKVDDPDLSRLTPPNHFNCRSILVPVMIDTPPSEYISAADKGTAIDMAGGFA